MAKFDSIRQRLMRDTKTLFEGLDFDVLTTGTQELCIPIVDEEGEEGYIVLTFKIPKGDRDGNPYDGYAVAEDFAMKQKAKAEKAKVQAEAKAKKIERDKKMREERKNTKQEKNVLGTTFCTYCGSNERKVYKDESETADSTNSNKYYKTFCPNCGHEGSILKQSFNKINEQKGE